MADPGVARGMQTRTSAIAATFELISFFCICSRGECIHAAPLPRLPDRRARHDGPPCASLGTGRSRAPSTGLDPSVVRRAFRAEMRHYAANADRGRDPESLAALRAECAALLSAELGRPIDVETMMGAIHFDAYPDAAPALRAWRGADCGSSASPTGTTSSATFSSGSGSRICSTGSSPPPARAPASPTRRSSSRPADRGLYGGRGDPHRRQRRGRRGRACGGDRRDQDRPGRSRGRGGGRILARRDRGARGADGQNGQMTESERPRASDRPRRPARRPTGRRLAAARRRDPGPLDAAAADRARPPRRRGPASRRDRSRRPTASS